MAGGAAMWRLAVRREGHFPPRVRLSFAEAGQLQSRCMAKVILKDLKKVYPNTEKKKKAKKGEESAEKKSSLQITEEGVVAVQQFSLEIADKEFIVLVGPSGCGKSTTLRMIAGLEDITSGKIYLDNTFLNDILPRDRKLAMAFQNYALYKYMNVYDNMALGLKLRDLPRTVINTRVKTAAAFLGISDILTKKIRSISDSERQRVALGRAIVCHPKVLLVDEDFAHQDDNLRKDMIHDILKINKELGITVLYVTNNYEEAVSLNSRIIFMKDGKVIEDSI